MSRNGRRVKSVRRGITLDIPANYYERNDQGKCEIEAAYMHAHNINGHVFGLIGHFEGCGWDGVNTCQPPRGYYLTGEARVGNKIVRSWRLRS